MFRKIEDNWNTNYTTRYVPSAFFANVGICLIGQKHEMPIKRSTIYLHTRKSIKCEGLGKLQKHSNLTFPLLDPATKKDTECTFKLKHFDALLMLLQLKSDPLCLHFALL